MARARQQTIEPAPAQSGFDDVYVSAGDGLRLHARDYGRRNPEGRKRLPLVCLPGLTRNARDFHELAMKVSSDPTAPRRVVCFESRGRGGSGWDKDPARYTVLVEAEDVLAGMAALGLAHAIFLGTSRGGLIMHVLAAMRPTVMAAGILNDIGPVIDGAGLAQIKAYLTRTAKPTNWEEAGPILRQAHGKSFPALSDRDWDDMARAIYTVRDGRLEPDFDPALLASLKDIDLSTPLPTLWPQFDGMANMPLLTLRGENSQLLSEKTLAEMQAHIPAMQIHTVAGHGHAPILHLSGLSEIIGKFLKSVDRNRSA
ncbi:pimeloyl-ACP methyl ester carboxylesterase [Hoeflea marina]|uniref:Pimeloyl-ACP methyl ester carboxylesterase n=1 Tax=Hoeflea marina TaxID=274592 RepID=A0A317PL80_9HYPH|nr:alpha/beta hydrolase [Hoeflea marina]PWV98803.1 pimeloyl-ACP methyl ester carboxylesterase [Hoeflea marina]